MEPTPVDYNGTFFLKRFENKISSHPSCSIRVIMINSENYQLPKYNVHYKKKLPMHQGLLLKIKFIKGTEDVILYI